MASHRICSVAGCDKPHDAKGYCGSHYGRFRRHGDPLAGGTYDYEPDKFISAALETDTDECIAWPYARTKRGYAIMGDRRMVCRIICESSIGPAPTPKHESAHSCGKGHEGCINWKHLRWATHKENIADRAAHGTNTPGEANGQSKLTHIEVREIRRLCGQMTLREIGDRFGVSESAVSMIIKRKRWKHIHP